MNAAFACIVAVGGAGAGAGVGADVALHSSAARGKTLEGTRSRTRNQTTMGCRLTTGVTGLASKEKGGVGPSLKAMESLPLFFGLWTVREGRQGRKGGKERRNKQKGQKRERERGCVVRLC